MINYIIIEDEPAAMRRLKRKISDLRPSWSCVGTADSIIQGEEILKNLDYHLIFSDIELSDGTCFELFQNVDFEAPIIYVTAYDKYAIKAFDFNGVHYLLKPIDDLKLEAALHKFESTPNQLNASKSLIKANYEDLEQTIISTVGNKTVLLKASFIVLFYHKYRITKAVLKNGQEHLLDHSLDAVMSFIPKNRFFRINRQFVVNKKEIKGFTKASSNRLKLLLHIDLPFTLIVSKENKKEFFELDKCMIAKDLTVQP